LVLEVSPYIMVKWVPDVPIRKVFIDAKAIHSVRGSSGNLRMA
jgi:hypothetical protein